MYTATLRRVGNSAVVTVPVEEMERIGLQDGDTVVVEVRRAEARYEPVLAEDLRPAVGWLQAQPEVRRALRKLGS